MSIQNSNDDCYFYYYSSCTKGDECPFRHCQQALGTETVCTLWKAGNCFRSGCKFRHMESRTDRSVIACYWENQPGGCRKPHCVFLHRKLRNGVQSAKPSPGLIFPTYDDVVMSKLPETKEPKNAPPAVAPPKETMSDDADDYIPDGSSVPVQPFVLKFDEEESDSESVTSTPVKITPNELRTGSLKSSLSSKLSAIATEKDFGIKTLEQIRMEKIHKESDSYYYTGYDSPSLEDIKSAEHMKEYYPPQSEFLSMTSDLSLDQTTSIKETKVIGSDKESDLRKRLSAKLTTTPPPPTKKSPLPLNFKVKTLDEIRKEREKKRANLDTCIDSSTNQSLSSSVMEHNSYSTDNSVQRPAKRLKITRPPIALFRHDVIVNRGAGIKNESEIDMMSNGIEKKFVAKGNTSQDEKTTFLLGKRKTLCMEPDTSSNKFPKVDSTLVRKVNNLKSASSINGVERDTNKPATLVLQPFLRQPNVLPSSKVVSVKPSDIPYTTPHITPSDAEKEVNRLSSDLVEVEPDSVAVPSDEVQHRPVPLTPTDEVSSTVSSDAMKDTKAAERSMSVDEFEHFLNESDTNVEEMYTSNTTNDDLLLEVEQFLDS